MSTHATITIFDQKHSTLHTIYCHYDGDFSEAGRILKEHYTSEEKINALIELGNISTLGAEVSTDQPHTFNNRVESVTVAYVRDREDTLEYNLTERFISLQEFIDEAVFEEFNYVFINGVWKSFDPKTHQFSDF